MNGKITLSAVLALFGFLFCAVVIAEELPGIGFDRTRVIFPEKNGQRGVSVTFNNNTSDDYLLQSRVVAPDTMIMAPDTLKTLTTTADAPFLVVPPLVRLSAHGHQVMRVLKKPGALPADRESVFLLESKAIPNSPLTGKEEGGVLRLAMASSIKLFYRPASLPASGIKAASGQLTFSREGASMVVNNPSPFWLTFAVLEVGGKHMEGDYIHWMVPPKGSVRYPLSGNVSGEVRWRLFDERGDLTSWAQGLLR